MEKIVCPYCECTVRMADVESEGGSCPECGALITGSLLFDNPNDRYEGYGHDEDLEDEDES